MDSLSVYLFICLFMCHIFDAFRVARLRTQTTAFESLGLRYVCPHFSFTSLHGQLDGVELAVNGVDQLVGRELC